MRVAEFFATLGFRSDNKGLLSFESALEDVKRNMIGVKELLLGGMIYGVGRFVNSSTQAADSMYEFNQQTGLSITRLQQWQQAASVFGVGADEVTGSIQGLQQQLTQLQKLGGGDINPFSRLGIDITGKDAYDILEDLRAAIPKYGRDVVSQLVSQMGVSPRMLQTLNLGEDEFSSLSNRNIRSMEVISENFKLGASIRLLGEKVSFAKDQFVAEFSPALQKAVKYLGDFSDKVFQVFGKTLQWLDENPQFFEILGKQLSFFGEMLERLAFSIGMIVTKIQEFFGDSPEKEPLQNLPAFRKLAAGEGSKALFGDTKGIRIKSKETQDYAANMRLIKMLPQMSNNLKPSVNNNYYINSTADAQEIAETIVKTQKDELQKIWNYGTTDFNNSGY